MSILKYTSIILSVILLSACGNLSSVSKEGTTEEPVWPKIDDSSFNHNGNQKGSWPNKNNIKLIGVGVNKDQIYNLIGRPHFSEGIIGVREWDYVFNFQENGVHKVCQFKILFDKNMDAQSFFWLPEECSSYVKESLAEKVEIEENNTERFVNHELSGDLLFAFDSFYLSNKGKESLSEIIHQFNVLKGKKIIIEGYTDPLGREEYNNQLSSQRAEVVKSAIVDMGISPSLIEAKGLGASVQIKKCSPMLKNIELHECLKPNRRVLIKLEY
ncbi:TPA: OmpA family protein [Escherichia coli]